MFTNTSSSMYQLSRLIVKYEAVDVNAETSQEVGDSSRKGRLLLLQASEECASEKMRNKGRRNMSLDSSGRTQEQSRGGSEANQEKGQQLGKEALFPMTGGRKFEKGHILLDVRKE